MMELNLIELTGRRESADVYDVYRHCMYMPTEEKFYKKMEDFWGNTSVKIFACLCGNERGNYSFVFGAISS